MFDGGHSQAAKETVSALGHSNDGKAIQDGGSTRKPEYGSKEGYVHIREQARVQVAARHQHEPGGSCVRW